MYPIVATQQDCRINLNITTILCRYIHKLFISNQIYVQYHETLVDYYLVNLVKINFKIPIKDPGGTRDMKTGHGFLRFRLKRITDTTG